ncbi:MAG: ATPase [Bacteroidales bacterium]|nr:ATPase [Bacteroidales bacterium]
MSKMWIADSGSTKTDWCLYEDGKENVRILTGGINPFYQDKDDIADIIDKNLKSYLVSNHNIPLYFYGAGITNEEKATFLKNIFSPFFGKETEIGSDLLGAARALCGHKPGIACILGTGSNSCFYDGKTIRKNISPLGFILGDEGSGAVIGKIFVGDLLKNQLPEDIKNDFLQTHALNMSEIIERVYKKPFPNRFLASFIPYIISRIDRAEVAAIVKKSIEAFFIRNIKQYDYAQYPVHFTGSLAYHIQDIIQVVAQKHNISVGTIISSPVEGLIKYHSSGISDLSNK